MKKIALTLLVTLSTISFAHAGKAVNQKYCDKTVEEVTEELQSQVNANQITLDKANISLALVRQTCEAAITDGLTKKEYESLFDKVKAKDCKGITDDINEAMPTYSASDRKYVANKINSMCSNAVLKGDSMLLLMYQVNEKLKEYGIL